MSETENGNKGDLLLFQLGPVQEFIVQAAEVSDLWAGSYLLSSLMWAGLDVIENKGDAVIFPNLRDGKVAEALAQKIPTIPNRFLAHVPAGEGMVVAGKVKAAIRTRLRQFGVEAQLPKEGGSQLEQFPQMTVAVLENPTGNFAGDDGDYKRITRRMALRRNLRDFEPWCETAPLGNGKDFLSGKETALKHRRGAMNLIKKRLGETHSIAINYPDNDKYIAVVSMDGDKMGERLSSMASEAEHRQFSANLAAFAMSVGSIVEKHGGSLIYAGGDDVLAVLPAKKAIAAAIDLQKKFGEVVGGSVSAGIAVGHEKALLQDLVARAKSAEHKAKHEHDRDALVVSVYKRSGETVQWGGKWNSPGLTLLHELNDVLHDDLSNRFPYKLAALLRPYEVEKLDENGIAEMSGVILAEVDHALEQSQLGEKRSFIGEEIKAYLNFTYPDEDGQKKRVKPSDFMNLFLCETFINRPREEQE